MLAAALSIALWLLPVLYIYSAVLKHRRRTAMLRIRQLKIICERSPTFPAADLKVVVTGGCGFLGSHVVSQLLEHGLGGRSVHVVAFDAQAGAVRQRQGGVTYVEGDVRDAGQLSNVFVGAAAVVHTVAVKPSADMLVAEAMESVTLGGTRAVLEACKDAGVPNLVHISSLSVGVEEGGEGALGRREDQGCAERPCGLYGKAKARAEQLVEAAEAPSLHTVRLRPGGIYGIGDVEIADRYTSAPQFYVSPGKQRIPWVWIRDAARAVRLATEAMLDPQRGPKVWGRAFHVTNDWRDGVTYADFVGVVPDPKRSRPGGPPLSHWGHTPCRPVSRQLFALMAAVNSFFASHFGVLVLDSSCCPEYIAPVTMDWTADITQARELLGWSPTPILESIRLIMKELDSKAAAAAAAVQ